MLRKEGFKLLCNLRLLAKSAGKCPTCNADYKLISLKTGDGLQWKCTKCKAKKKSIRNNSIFSSSKLSIYKVIIIMFLFSSKTPAKVVIRLLDVSDKIVTDWTRYLCNACTRVLHLLVIKLGGLGKWVQINKTHWFKVPKYHRGEYRKHRNWLFVVFSKDSSLVYYQLVCKRTRLALEIIIFSTIRPGTHIESN